MSNPSRGSAILVALFFLVLVSTFMLQFLYEQKKSIHFFERHKQANQRDYYAKGMVDFAIESLYEKSLAKEEIPSSEVFTEMNFKNHKVQLSIEQLQGRFNINNIKSSRFFEQFVRLMQILEPDLSSPDAYSLAENVKAWIVKGEEENNRYYETLATPFRLPERSMVNISELLFVRTMTPSLYKKLIEHCVVLPTITPINLNNASAEVIQSIHPEITKELALQVVTQRDKENFKSINDFLAIDWVKSLSSTIEKKNLTIEGSYFLVKTKIAKEKAQYNYYAVIYVYNKTEKPSVSLLWQGVETW